MITSSFFNGLSCGTVTSQVPSGFTVVSIGSLTPGIVTSIFAPDSPLPVILPSPSVGWSIVGVLDLSDGVVASAYCAV